jgi:hypothetical protein
LVEIDSAGARFSSSYPLICVPTTAVVAIVALVVIYLGVVGVGVLLTLGGGGYGTKRLLARHQRRRSRIKT